MGWNLRYLPGWGIVALCVGEGSEKQQCHLLSSRLAFSHFPCNPQVNWSFWCWFLGRWFCVCLGPCGSLQRTFLWGWEFLPPPQPPQVFTARGFEAFFSRAGSLGCVVCLAPQFLLVYLHVNVGLPSLPATTLPWFLSAPAACLCPSHLSGWMFLL